MSKEIINTIKQEAIKLIPKGILSVLLMGGVSYGYVNTLTILPASSKPYTSAQKSNFIHASMVEAGHYVSDLPQCHIFEQSHDVGTCHDVEALVWSGESYCIYPKLPGKCN